MNYLVIMRTLNELIFGSVRGLASIDVLPKIKSIAKKCFDISRTQGLVDAHDYKTR